MTDDEERWNLLSLYILYPFLFFSVPIPHEYTFFLSYSGVCFMVRVSQESRKRWMHTGSISD